MVYTLGESLLDIIFTSGLELTARPGGSMLNTAVSLGRCQVQVSLISELGDDRTAEIILGFLDENRVERRYVRKYFRQATSVALAFLDEAKVPQFSIHKSYPVKRHLAAPAEFSDDDILLFGSMYSLDPAIRSQLHHILVTARQAGALLCYDPNIRSHNLDIPEMREALQENLALAHLVKASTEDLFNIYGDMETAVYAERILQLNPDAAVIITRGGEGASCFYGNKRLDMPAEPVNVVSTIGAGDAFTAGIARALVRSGKKPALARMGMDELLRSGIAFASAVCATMDNYVPHEFRI